MGFNWPVVTGLGDYLRLMRDVARASMRHTLEAEAWATKLETERTENESLRRYMAALEDENAQIDELRDLLENIWVCLRQSGTFSKGDKFHDLRSLGGLSKVVVPGEFYQRLCKALGKAPDQSVPIKKMPKVEKA